MELRDGTADDIGAMFALDVLCFEPPFCFDLNMMRRSAMQPGALVLLAEEAQELRGFVVLSVRKRRRLRPEAYVETIDVHPDYRRAGIARTLMEAAECRLREAGVGLLCLHVFERNEAAIRFYERNGFRVERVIESFYGPGLNARPYSKLL